MSFTKLGKTQFEPAKTSAISIRQVLTQGFLARSSTVVSSWFTPQQTSVWLQPGGVASNSRSS